MKIHSMIDHLILAFLFISNCPFISALEVKPPRLTIIIVIDQFAYHYLPRLEQYFTGGIKLLMINGISYTQAYWPHAMPSTGVGHTALNTGTFANYHGIMNNSWRNKDLQKIEGDDAPVRDAAVFSPDGLYSYGKSAATIMVDGVSDQLMLQSRKDVPITVFALSHKSYSAIGNAGKLGKAIWFDTKAGKFTSSKAYFDKLPDWLIHFNKKYSADKLMKQPFKPFFNKESDAYAVVDNTTAPFQRTLSARDSTIDNYFLNNDSPYKPFIETKEANTLLLDLAKEFLQHHLTKNKNHRIVLWISLSPLDKLGHLFGPQSMEVVDMIYHLDYQLKQFMNFTGRRIKQSEVLYVLTADHGVEPMPEYLQEKGIKSARRILIPQLVQDAENHIKQQHGISLSCAIKVPQLYFDKRFDTLSKQRQDAILTDIKAFLERQEGIKKTWTYHEITNECVNKDQIEYYYKNQQFPGRSGQITFQVFPYVQLTKHPTGTAHRTPYEWNTHVPLIFYQKGTFEHKIINKHIWILQFANSLAQIHKVPKPSASTFELLPGLFPVEDISY